MKFPRIIGRYSTGRAGPTLLVVGGLHGNEPSGALAAQRVMKQIAAVAPSLRGELVLVGGNLTALRRGVRYVDRDLNRCWGQARQDDVEGRERAELRRVIDDLEAPLIVLDLHTTSGKSAPFTLMSDTRRNRRIAFALPIPVVLGLEEAVDGTLLERLAEQGHTAIVVEAGQHDDPRSIDRHEAAIWLVLVTSRMLAGDAVPGDSVGRLREAVGDLPRVVEVRHSQPVTAGFLMDPGFEGFQVVAANTVLARDDGGEIRAPVTGRLLMPLYQEQGSDGFFLAKRVSRFWIVLSEVLRFFRVGKALTLLPGVAHHPTRENTLRVNPGVARWFVVEVFHLLGFRRRRPEDGYLIFSRRRPG